MIAANGLVGFRFNLKHAVIGKFTSEKQRLSLRLGYPHFIATRILPCGPVDTVMKFTGNDDEGDAPRPGEVMLATLHAFAHFTFIYTHKNFLLCDLQGALDVL